MIITRTNPFNGKTYSLDIAVTEDQIRAWKSGMLIQNAMPGVSPAHREFIMTGIPPEDWDELFKGEDE